MQNRLRIIESGFIISYRRFRYLSHSHSLFRQVHVGKIHFSGNQFFQRARKGFLYLHSIPFQAGNSRMQEQEVVQVLKAVQWRTFRLLHKRFLCRLQGLRQGYRILPEHQELSVQQLLLLHEAEL